MIIWFALDVKIKIIHLKFSKGNSLVFHSHGVLFHQHKIILSNEHSPGFFGSNEILKIGEFLNLTVSHRSNLLKFWLKFILLLWYNKLIIVDIFAELKTWHAIKNCKVFSRS